ncbi:MAG: polysaccharide deacetylase family protein [Roseburia sp.]|nr:polysaccharide deacetylase family protein [Roseburia sp.]
MKKKNSRRMLYVVLVLMVMLLALSDAMIEKYKTVSVSSNVEKKVAITFDDGPNPDYTPDLLKGLKERGVSATFFLLGKEAEKYPELVLQMYEEGHLLATHSYAHVNLCNLNDEAAVEQVVKTNTIIEEITGECPQFIRPPFGCWKENLDYKTTMIPVLWDVDPLDWNTNNTAVIVKRVLTSVEDGDIILLHDASQSSVDAALLIIDQLQKEGYLFVTVEEMVLD